MAFVLYTIAEVAHRFNIETGSSYREETLRNRIKAARLTIHKIGNLDLVTEDDLIRLMRIPAPKKGRPAKGGR